MYHYPELCSTSMGHAMIQNIDCDFLNGNIYIYILHHLESTLFTKNSITAGSGRPRDVWFTKLLFWAQIYSISLSPHSQNATPWEALRGCELRHELSIGFRRDYKYPTRRLEEHYWISDAIWSKGLINRSRSIRSSDQRPLSLLLRYKPEVLLCFLFCHHTTTLVLGVSEDKMQRQTR